MVTTRQVLHVLLAIEVIVKEIFSECTENSSSFSNVYESSSGMASKECYQLYELRDLWVLVQSTCSSIFFLREFFCQCVWHILGQESCLSHEPTSLSIILATMCCVKISYFLIVSVFFYDLKDSTLRGPAHPLLLQPQSTRHHGKEDQERPCFDRALENGETKTEREKAKE